MNKLLVLPRILRACQAPGYLGMCRDVFNKIVRPYLREFPIGQRGIGFDRIELDQWADAYIAAHSINKRGKAEQPPLPIDAQQSKRKKRGPVMTGLATSTSANKQPTAEDFYRLVAEIMVGSADKKARRRNKQNHQQPPTEE